MSALTRLPARYLKAVMVITLWVALVASLLAATAIANYLETSETSGILWWKETRAIPLSERRPSLVAGVILVILVAVLLVAAAVMALTLWRSRDERRAELAAAEARRLEAEGRRAQIEAHEAWLLTYEGQAWAAFQRGDREFAATLRIQPPEHRETIREVEGVGWVLRGQHDHGAVRVKESRRNLDGGHTVVTTTTKDATFYFDRGRPGVRTDL